jgi:putative FmdB family regulatory protein
MPTYEYVCDECAHAWEAFQSIKDRPLTSCPACGRPSAKRQVSLGTGFILKGGGWYADLYGSQKSKTESSTTGTSDGGKASESGGKASGEGAAASGASAPSTTSGGEAGGKTSSSGGTEVKSSGKAAA